MKKKSFTLTVGILGLIFGGCEPPKFTLDDESSVFNDSTGTTTSGSENTNNNTSTSSSGGSADAAPRPTRDGGAHRPDAGSGNGNTPDAGTTPDASADGGATARCQTDSSRNIAFIGSNPSMAAVGNDNYVVGFDPKVAGVSATTVFVTNGVTEITGGPALSDAIGLPTVSGAGDGNFMISTRYANPATAPYDWELRMFDRNGNIIRDFLDYGPMPLLASAPGHLLLAAINLETGVPACGKNVAFKTFVPETNVAPFQEHNGSCLPHDFEGRRASMMRFAANASMLGLVQLVPDADNGDYIILVMRGYDGVGSNEVIAQGDANAALEILALTATEYGFAVLWRDSNTPAGSSNFTYVGNDHLVYAARRIAAVGHELVWNGRYFLLASNPQQDAPWVHLLSETGEFLSDVGMFSLRPVEYDGNNHVSIVPRGNGFAIARDGLYETNEGDVHGISVHALDCQ